MPTWDSLWTNVNLATMAAGDAPYGAIENGALAVEDGRIAWVGAAADLPHRDAGEVVDGAGGWLTPGLIDCHTHLVFAGDRSGEFEQRLEGVSYEEIARAGGGIARTVAATRAGLARRARGSGRAPARRAARRRRHHGRDQVRLRPRSRHRDQDARGRARRSGEATRSTSAPPFSAPTRCRRSIAERSRAAISTWCARRCCRRSPHAASPMRSTRSARASRSRRTRWRACSRRRARSACRSSCTPISSPTSAALRSRRALARLSADHLEYASEAGIRAMATAGTVAVLLPARSIPCASASSRRSSCCAGTACRWRWPPTAIPAPRRSLSLLAILNIACTLFGLTPEEALAGVTRHAARALGLDDRGTLEVGKRADLALWRIHRPAELSYWFGFDPLEVILQDGRRSYPGAVR